MEQTGKNPMQRIKRTLAQVAAVLIGVPAVVVTVNAAAAEAGSDWRVPAVVVVGSSIGAAAVAGVSTLVNLWEQARGEG
jgi:malonyl CoA-acyl carrier protein transacylase